MSEWQPPSDAVAEEPAWTPPQDAVEVKKKENGEAISEPSLNGGETSPISTSQSPLTDPSVSHFDRMLPYIKEQAAQSFANDPRFQSKTFRDAYYKATAKNYTGRDYFKVLATLMEVDPYAKKEAQEQLISDINPLGETVPQVASNITTGIERGIEKVGETKDVYEKEGLGSAALNAVVGTGEAAMGAANVIPAVSAFMLGTEALQEKIPEVEAVIAPATSYVNEKYTKEGKEIPKWLENSATVGDFIWQVLLFKGIEKGQKITTDFVKEKIESLTPQELTEVEEKVTPHPDNLKATDIENDIAKNPERPINDVLQEQATKLRNGVVVEKHNNIVKEAEVETLKSERDNLQSQMTDLSEASKEVLQPALNKANEQIKTMSDELKVGDTVEMDVKPKEEVSDAQRQKDFFAKGDEIVNAEIDRVNKLREETGLKPISKNKNTNENKIFRQSLSSKLGKESASKTKEIPEELKLLAEETKKYVTAEEFENALKEYADSGEMYKKGATFGNAKYTLEEANLLDKAGYKNVKDFYNDVKTINGETKQQFKDRYIATLKEKSPDQPKTWYEYQAEESWKKKQSQKIEDIPAPDEVKKTIATTEESSGATGISIKAREQRAETLGTEATESGVGWTGAEALARGNELRSKGVDPVEMIADEKIPLHDKVAIAQSYANELGKKTNEAGDKFGLGSKEYTEAKQAEDDYLKQVKPLSTLSHKAFAAHQGEVEIDTGSWTGLIRAVETDGKKATGKQIGEAKQLSGKVKTLTNQVEKLKQQLTDALNAAVEETPKNIKQRAKEIADIIRKGKTSRPSVFSAASPASLVWDGALEVAAKTVETGGTVAQALIDGIAHIKASEWYKNFDKKDEAEKAFADHFNEFANDDIFTKFVDKKDSKFTTEQVRDIWNYAKENYLDKGRTYEDMLSGVAKDLGLDTKQVRTALAQPKNAKTITDEMYRTQYKRNQAVNSAKQWVKQSKTPFVVRAVKAIPAFFFEKAIFGHGTVGMITHSGLNMFNPASWKSYWTNFGRQFKYLAKPAEYEKAKEDLQNKDNYITARRAGLANDPNSIYDDYGGFKKFFGKGAMAGDRGFFALKTFRQELFDHYYDKLAESEKDPQMAKEIASIVNHATGTHKIPVPEAIGVAVFAPRLEASRWERMIVEPAKAVVTFTDWKNATPSEKAAAKIISKRAGAIAATYFAGLAINQGLLSASGSDRKINFLNPLKSDWLKFKFGEDKTIDPTGGMVSSMHFLAKLLELPTTTKQERHGQSVFSEASQEVGQYAAGKLSPFGSTAKEVYTSHDYSGNTMPWSDEPPNHKYNHKLSWKEWLWSQAPIPASEGARDVYREMENKGISEPEIEDYFTGVWVGLVSGGTGARVGVEPKVAGKTRARNNSTSRNSR